MRSRFGRVFQREGRRGWYVRVRRGDREETLKAGDTRAAANRAVRRMRASYEEERASDGPRVDPVRFEDFAGDYLAHCERVKTASTYSSEKSKIRGVLVPWFGARMLDEIERVDVARFLASRAKTVSAATRNRDVAQLSAMFRHAIELGYAAENPAAGIPREREEERDVPWVERDDQVVMMEATPARVRDFCWVALETGLRRGELLALLWRHVQFNRGVIAVTRSKSKRSRDVPMTNRVRAILEERWRHRVIPVDGPDRVFPELSTARGSWLNRQIAVGARAIGRDDLRLHDLRHLFAANLATRGVPLTVIQRLLGHGSIQMTMRYSRHLPGDATTHAIATLDDDSARGTTRGTKAGGGSA